VIVRLFYLFVGAICFGAVNSYAGDISKRSYSRYFEWESSECYMPSAPYIYELTESNKWEATNFVDEIQSYINCVSNEASEDYRSGVKKLAQGIEESRDEEIQSAEDELESFMSSLGL